MKKRPAALLDLRPLCYWTLDLLHSLRRHTHSLHYTVAPLYFTPLLLQLCTKK